MKWVRGIIPKTLVLSIFIVHAIAGCKEKYNINPEYKDDRTWTLPQGFKFDEKNLPQIGMSENDLLGLYPVNPTLKYTFTPSIVKVIHGKKFNMDRVYVFGEAIIEKKEGPENTEFNFIESRDLTVFIENGKVVQYLISHLIRDKHNNWQPGQYHTDETTGEWVTRSWPGSRQDLMEYWQRRGDGKELDRMVQNGDYKSYFYPEKK